MAKWLIICFLAVEFWGVVLWLALDEEMAEYAAMRVELEAMGGSLERIERELGAMLTDVQEAGGAR